MVTKATKKKAKVETKAEVEVEAEEADVNRELAWQDLWDSNESVRALTTRAGRMRGGLKPSQQKEAKTLLKEHGF